MPWNKKFLEDYPLYFKRDSVEDLVEKIKLVLNGDFKLDKIAIKKIKSDYSLETCVRTLLEYINSLF